MSVSTRKPLHFTVVVTLLVAAAAFANNPSPRSEVRMVYNPATSNSILFGGRSAVDYGTASAYYTNETWSWNGSRWSQRFPAHAPSARSAQSMVFDTLRSRVFLFGGRDSDAHVLGDTWVYSEEENEWHQVPTATAPPARQVGGIAYDPLRDRIVLYGGNQLTTDGANFEPRRDMWEFDGTNWRQILTEGPNVIKPALVWDGARNQMLMLGIDSDSKTLMYAYNPATTSWNEVKPAALPPCANEATLTYMEHDQLVALIGGLCNAVYDQSYYYDGTTWLPFGATTSVGYLYGHATTYDVRRDAIVVFGGAEGTLPPRSVTLTYNAGNWHLMDEVIRPRPRALATFASDPLNKAIWMFGGLNEYSTSYFDDFWKYQNGSWSEVAPSDSSPSACGSAASTIDTDRSKLIIACAGNVIYEYDLKEFTWKKVVDTKAGPVTRTHVQLAYDPELKKTVMYGGFDAANYRDDTWLWDGATWTEVKKNKADARSNAAIWFDPSLKKVILYGGIGRPKPENTIRRYSDMWSLDGTNGWTKMSVSATPGERYSAQVLVDPHTNKVRLFGGVRVDDVDDKTKKQVFGNDLWEWNGTAWTKITDTVNPPSARQSFGLGYDAYADRFVIFSGYNGLFLSDVWTSSNWRSWEPREESLMRRRVIRR